MNYYNEHDPFAAAWLHKLVEHGHISNGVVDDRDIQEISADDLRGFKQCHFFAGIGGWSYALRLAGWPDDRPVWTGSPPCQPFSVAGKQLGKHDERHLTPHFLELVRAVRPAWLFGEQVSAAVKKDMWLDDLLDELENQGYATGAAVLPACSVGAPHLRQRIFFVAHHHHARLERRQSVSERPNQQSPWENCVVGSLALSDNARCCPGGEATSTTRYGDTVDSTSWSDRHGTTNEARIEWDSMDWLFCTDGKWRPVEPGTFPLADGVPAQVGRLRGYGNAIVPAVAAEVVRAVME